jgi:hypothetical protein
MTDYTCPTIFRLHFPEERVAEPDLHDLKVDLCAMINTKHNFGLGLGEYNPETRRVDYGRWHIQGIKTPKPLSQICALFNDIENLVAAAGLNLLEGGVSVQKDLNVWGEDGEKSTAQEWYITASDPS